METVDLGRVIFFSRGTSVQFSHSVMSNSVTPMDCSIPGFPVHHQLLELAQTHVPQVSDNHPTISSSVDPFSSCLQSFPASESFLISQFFASGGQSLGASASASVLPMNIQWIMRCLDDPRRRQWHPTPVLLPRKSHGQRSLVGCSPWGRYSRIRLSDFTFTFHFYALEKEMATQSSVLAWRIPGRGGLVSCRLWGRTESETTEATQQQQQQ